MLIIVKIISEGLHEFRILDEMYTNIINIIIEIMRYIQMYVSKGSSRSTYVLILGTGAVNEIASMIWG